MDLHYVYDFFKNVNVIKPLKKEKVMKGHLVKLRAMEEEDYELFAEWVTPSKTSSLARGGNDFVTSEEIKADIESSNTQHVMVLTHEDEKIGFISWTPQKYSGNYQLGGVIGVPGLWDSGYGAEAGALAMEYLFHQKNAHKIQFINGLYNLRTVRFIMKSEIVIEGILRDHFFVDGEYHDAIVSSILREEYYGYTDTDTVDSIPKEDKRKIRQELSEYLDDYWAQNDFFQNVKE